MIETLILGAIAITAALYYVYIAYLIWSILVQWFQEFAYLVNRGNHVAFTLEERLNSGQYKTVQGIFNTNSNDVTKIRGIKSDSLDSQIREAHRGSELVIWQ